MARYIHDYQETTGEPFPPSGMDPNYRGRYRGMRMGAEGGQGAYGEYRRRHAGELGGSGFEGESIPRRSRYDQGYRGYDRGFRGYDRGFSGYDRGYRSERVYDWETRGGGGLRDPRYDREFLRGFNANTPGYRGDGPRDRYGVDYRERGDHPVNRDTRFRFGYGNRGLSGSGFSEAWQHRPGHGSR